MVVVLLRGMTIRYTLDAPATASLGQVGYFPGVGLPWAKLIQKKGEVAKDVSN